MTTKVKLRQKSISKGRKSLYLDFYPAIPNTKTGELTRREFLGLYIIEKPKTAIAKKDNSETLLIAESIRQKRENQLNKPEIYNEYEKERLRVKELGEQSFINYFKTTANKRSGSNYSNWNSALAYLENFTNGDIKFSEVNEVFLEEFKEYLLSTKSRKSDKVNLSINSAVSYFNKVKATLKQAYKDGILQVDINSKVKAIKTEETRREFLTIEELNKLVETPCKNDLLKRAALFSALSGLRFSDIAKMTWYEIEFIENQGYFINFKQKKTMGVEVLPISEQAYEFTNGNKLPSEMPQNEKVFRGLVYSLKNNNILYEWIKEAGIRKKISFHNFRHTYATLQLYMGTDIYTVSKLLGHKNLKTTQIYAKVVDQAKIEASNRIKLG